MHIDPRNKGIQTYRAAKEKAKRKATLRNEILAGNPDIDTALLSRIVDTRIAKEDAAADKEKQARRSKSRKPTHRRKWSKSQANFNNALCQGVSDWNKNNK